MLRCEQETCRHLQCSLLQCNETWSKRGVEVNLALHPSRLLKPWVIRRFMLGEIATEDRLLTCVGSKIGGCLAGQIASCTHCCPVVAGIGNSAAPAAQMQPVVGSLAGEASC